jgi:hypothetical protein
MKKLRADRKPGMLAIIRCRIFGLPVDFPKIYKTIILPVERGHSHLREERRLGVLENRVLRRIFGPKRDEVTGDWGNLHIEELNYLYPSPSITRVNKSRRM